MQKFHYETKTQQSFLVYLYKPPRGYISKQFAFFDILKINKITNTHKKIST